MAEVQASQCSPVCLCVLCGLPAAGKSSLAKKILLRVENYGWRATVVSYDELIPQNAFRLKQEREETHTEWKMYRTAVLEHIKHVLLDPCEGMKTKTQSGCPINNNAWGKCLQDISRPESLKFDRSPILFLLDDNFYYPSMRYEVFQLARKYSLSFCQVYLECGLESCITRNESRSQPVPTDVMLEMAKRLEPPNPKKNSWETQSISLNSENNFSNCDVQRVVDLISSALRNPLKAAEDDTEQKEADRQKNAVSVIHQADQVCRRLISESMKTAKENHISPEHMRLLAAQLNESKTGFLHDLRQHIFQETPLIQREELDGQVVVKRAMDIFDTERKKILILFINNHTST